MTQGKQRAKGFLELAAEACDSSLVGIVESRRVSSKPIRASVTLSGSRSPPSQMTERAALFATGSFRSKRWSKDFLLGQPRCCLRWRTVRGPFRKRLLANPRFLTMMGFAVHESTDPFSQIKKERFL
jgi:hypothetical protein